MVKPNFFNDYGLPICFGQSSFAATVRPGGLVRACSCVATGENPLRKIGVIAAALVAVVGLPLRGSSAQEQKWPTTVREARAFVSDMPADAWIRMMQASLSLKYFIGKPVVAVFNPGDEDLVNVTCDGKWILVGPNPYIKGAPASIPSHTVGFIPTDGFDKYCTKSITGVTDNGSQKTGALSIPGNFTDSTAIYFTK